MGNIGDLYQTSDWKTEKHVPVIECPDAVGSEELFQVKVSLGKEIAHPNTTEHHIRWIQLFFKPDGEKSAFQVGNFEFTAHGESTLGANKGPVYTNHTVIAEIKVSSAGTLYATAFCNIHGFWQSSKAVAIK